jgi:hypothetical protein
MKKAILAMLNDGERASLRQTEGASLARLDEDALIDLHTRVRRVRNKYTTLYRRRASAQVQQDSGRAKAHAQHARTAANAEAFEDALARVSRALAKAARARAVALRAERLDATRRTQSPPRRRPTRRLRVKPAIGAREAPTPRPAPITERARASARENPSSRGNTRRALAARGRSPSSAHLT